MTGITHKWYLTAPRCSEPLTPEPDWQRFRCATCGAEVWIGEAGQLTLKSCPEREVSCHPCTFARLKEAQVRARIKKPPDL